MSGAEYIQSGDLLNAGFAIIANKYACLNTEHVDFDRLSPLSI